MIATNPKVMTGPWQSGFTLDVQTISSEYLGDDEFGHPHFDTKRSELGALILKLKYRSDKTAIKPIVDCVADFLTHKWKIPDKIDILIPVPPSDTRRVFQPVIELAKEISKQTGIPLSSALIKTHATPQIKDISESQSRMDALKDAFSISGTSLSKKNVLLFDDIYCSGETLISITDVLLKQGNAAHVYVLALTRTRVKK